MTIFVTLALCSRAWCAVPETWGNIVGQVLNAPGSPSSEASVCTADPAICCRTGTDGFFILSGIPLASWDGDSLDLVVSRADRRLRLHRLFVPPGAILAPRLTIDLSKISDSVVDPRTQVSAPPSIRDDPFALPAGRKSGDALSVYSVFATREGLVGLKTANGHVIVPNDHFAAMPSRRALNRTDSPSDLEFEVRLAREAETVRLPVWDVGPWCTKDDWWNEAPFRQTATDPEFGPLPRGVPLAQAAFLHGYNGGRDDGKRAVRNQAGIDLADGAFWLDLSMTDNAAVNVETLWQLDAAPGSRVWARHWAKIRQSPGGTVVDTALCGESGTIQAAPDSATVSNHWYLFYQVAWDKGGSGWSAENFLTASPNPSCTDAVHPLAPPTPLVRIEGNRLVAAASLRDAYFTVFGPDGTLLQATTRLAESCLLPKSVGLQFVVVQDGRHRRILKRLP